MTDLELLTDAVLYAAGIHADQRRKGVAAEPYINHLAEVAYLVATATKGEDLNLVIAAYLHDAIEDQDRSREELATLFGDDVASLVAEVSDDKNLPKETRKAFQIENAGNCTDRAKVLKLADKCANLAALIYSPPVDWPLERKQDYFDWARQVVAGCRGANASLEASFDELYSRREELS